MTRLELLKKQIAEMRRLRQHKIPAQSSKYRELIAQVYEEFKKINKRAPNLKEWVKTAGVDEEPINKLRKTGNYPLGRDMESVARGRIKARETTYAKPETKTLASGNKIIGVRYRNAADKTKVRDILTKYFSVPVNERDIEGTVKQLRTLKDLKPKTSRSIILFMGEARKDLNIKSVVVTEAAALHRPANVSEHILRSLTEHIRQKGTDFKYAPKGEATVYGQLKIIDNKTGNILTRDSIREAIKNNDPRFREYKTIWDRLQKLRETPFTHPLTRETMTLAKALDKATEVEGSLHLDHIRGVKTNPLNDLQIATWKANMAKAKLGLTTKEAKLFGVRTVAPGGTSIIGPKILPAKQQADLIKFATDLFKKGGTRKVLKPKAHLDQFIAIVKKSGGCRYLTEAQGGGAVATCAEIIKRDPVGSANKLATMEATSGALGKVKNAATNFLKLLGRVGTKAAPLAALAVAGAAIEPLVRQFRNDDPSTYLTDESQMKGMLLATIEGETPKVDEEILKWQYPGMAASAAAAIPGSKAVYKARRLPFTKTVEGVAKTRAAMGIPRAALGPVGKFLAGTFSPLGVAATLPISVAAQRKGGTEWGDIATDPFNWMAPAFAATGAEMATKGIRNPLLLKALRLGMKPSTLRMISSKFGIPGLAISAGLWGYDKWKNRSINDPDE